MSTELVEPGQQVELAYRHELTVEEVVARVKKVKDVTKALMVEHVHYGVVPGTDKPTLLQPGAQLLNLTFRLTPRFKTQELWEEGGHLTVKSICESVHIPTGQVWGSGEAMCSTREAKYAFRNAKRTCPKCGAEQLNKSKFPPRDKALGTEPGWYCHAKYGGCGAEFAVLDPKITEQRVGLIPNPNIADQYNTVTKMANKRSQNTSVLNATGASDVFTTDMDDMAENEAVVQGTVVTPQPGSDGAKEAPPGGDQRGPDLRPISDAQKGRLWAIAREHGWPVDEVKALYQKAGFEHVEQITRADYEGIVNSLKEKRKDG